MQHRILDHLGRTACLLLALIAAASFGVLAAGCGDDTVASEALPSAETGRLTITDLAGRQVQVPAPTARICALGPGALRLVCYVEAVDHVLGIEAFESKWKTGRPYAHAYPGLLDLPVVGQGGPDTSPDAESLIAAAPDVIFVAYLLDASAAKELQQKTGIPVVVLSYGPLGSFNEEVMRSIEIVGQVTGHAERARDVVSTLESWLADLDARTADVPADERPPVYAGAVGLKGTHGIESTQANFPPFMAINAANVADETGASDSVMIDKEQLLEWNPRHVFIDEAGYSMMLGDYEKNPGLYRSLSAFRAGEVWGYLPFNFYVTNIGTALADAYFMGSVIYPDRFEDIDATAKADDIYTFLLGTPLYDQMAADFGGYIRLDPGGRE